MAVRRKFWFILIVLVILGITVYLARAGRVAPGSVLVLDLTGPVEEQKAPGALGAFLGSDIVVVHQVLDAIDAAKNDARIAGLLVKVHGPEARWAKLQEIRQHLLEFRKSGKPSICLLAGDLNPNRDYYVSTACGEVWLIPTAPLGVTGLMTESRFLRGTFEKLKIAPDFLHIAEYKTAANQYMEKKYTPAHREMAESLMRSTYDQYVTDLSTARKLERPKVEALLAQGPFLAHEAIDNKLVDRLGYLDEVHTLFKNRTQEWRPITLSRYAKQIKNEGTAKIAVVNATGLIIVGQSDWSPSNGFIMGSDSVAADLRRAREDSSIKAIVFRVDSPGGSAVASDIIGREVGLAVKEKPVVVSMSDVAGSGGYWIAMSANKILADPSTLTGSIGVVVGKLNIEGLYEMVGYSSDHLQTSENASIWWERQNFTPAQRAIVQKMMNSIYSDFTKGVSTGRHLSVERVNEIGRGRVWTGSQGKEVGLVDEIGDLTRAVAVARGLAKIPADAKVRVVYYPAEKTWFESLASSEEKQTAMGLLTELRRVTARLSAPMEVRMPFEIEIR
jgi:protease-4